MGIQNLNLEFRGGGVWHIHVWQIQRKAAWSYIATMTKYFIMGAHYTKGLTFYEPTPQYGNWNILWNCFYRYVYHQSSVVCFLYIHISILYVTIYFIITSYFVLSWETLSLCIESPWWNSIFYPKYLFIINILWKMFHLNTPLTANVCNAICSYSLCLYLP